MIDYMHIDFLSNINELFSRVFTSTKQFRLRFRPNIYNFIFGASSFSAVNAKPDFGRSLVLG